MILCSVKVKNYLYEKNHLHDVQVKLVIQPCELFPDKLDKIGDTLNIFYNNSFHINMR